MTDFCVHNKARQVTQTSLFQPVSSPMQGGMGFPRSVSFSNNRVAPMGYAIPTKLMIV